MFRVWMEDDLYVIKLSVLKENFLESFFFRVKRQVPKSEVNVEIRDDKVWTLKNFCSAKFTDFKGEFRFKKKKRPTL